MSGCAHLKAEVKTQNQQHKRTKRRCRYCQHGHGRAPWIYFSSPLLLLTLFFFGGGVSWEPAALAWVESTWRGGLLQVTPISKGNSTSLTKVGDRIRQESNHSSASVTALISPVLDCVSSGGAVWGVPPPLPLVAPGQSGAGRR